MKVPSRRCPTGRISLFVNVFTHTFCHAEVRCHVTPMTRCNISILGLEYAIFTTRDRSAIWYSRFWDETSLGPRMWAHDKKKRYLPLQLDEKLEVCHCAGRPFRRIPLLISSTGQRPVHPRGDVVAPLHRGDIPAWC